MSKRRRQSSRRQKRSDRPTVDMARLIAISAFHGWLELDGQRYPIVSPLGDLEAEDHMEFDREMCAAGLKAFVRPTMSSGTPNPEVTIDGGPLAVAIFGPFTEPYILVREFQPGVRSRIGVDIVSPAMFSPSAN